MSKENYIDDVDVSGCPYYIDSDGSCSSHDCECIKCIHNECFYKDYKRKEQECEELNADNISLRDRVGKLERAILRRNEQLDQLKKTNEELQKENEELTKNYFIVIQQRNKVEKALAEIKEIAEEAGNTQFLTFPDFSLQKNAKILMRQFNRYLQQILQKISEVVE